MIEDRLKTVELARTLFVERLSAYWNHTDHLPSGGAISNTQWKSTIGKDVEAKWYQDCLETARAIMAKELEYLNS